MAKRTAISISVCFIVSILCISMLYKFADRVNHRKNGFTRLFRPHLIGFKNELDLKYNSYYIAGLSKRNIYLGNIVSPTHALIVDSELSDTNTVEWKVQQDLIIGWKYLRLSIDSPHIYLLEGITSSLFKGMMPNSNTIYQNLNNIRFSISLPISPTSIIVRNYDPRQEQNILTKINVGFSLKATNTYKLEKQQDGVFCTDGMLTYDPKSAKIFYIYFYRNQFACLDTNLNLLYRANTIDTVNHPQIKIAKIHSAKETTLAEPPPIVNKKCSVSERYLFVNSGLKANNEEKVLFNEYSVIDVYNLVDGEYQFSFYLPKHRNIKLTNFRVYENTLIALYDHYILTFILKS